MARKPRVEFTGAFYHVICRGNQRQVIFRSDADRNYYLEPLEQYRQRYGFKVYGGGATSGSNKQVLDLLI